jgi:L-seryl-tRNA(Ser) seleniumtransferase
MPDYRVIPSIEELRQRPAIAALVPVYGHEAVIAALRDATGVLRAALSSGPADGVSADAAAARIEGDAVRWLAAAYQPSLRRVFNATGVIVHTNLGRAPLPDAALERVRALGVGYTNLEYDLGAGTRGRRDVHAEALLVRLTGAESAVVVNNCAGAMLLVLAALARGREVVVSRGELVEIGGGFRVPDVMAQSGATLREVGTTNRARAADYALAIGDRTAAILRVHPSNFTMEGFTGRATLAELVALGRKFQIPVIEDLGSGLVTLGTALEPLPDALRAEPSVQATVAAGVDVVCFSGDKLLGGPQAGIIVGRADLVARVRAHPLMRALRVDKLTYAALEATLVEHLAGRATETIPAVRMATLPVEAIAVRAETLAAALRRQGLGAEVVDGVSTIGGGSASGSALPTRLVALSMDGLSADALESRLRALDPPVVARIQDDRVVLDLRTIGPSEDEALGHALAGVVPRL